MRFRPSRFSSRHDLAVEPQSLDGKGRERGFDLLRAGR